MSTNIFDGADIAERHGKMLNVVLAGGGSVGCEIECPSGPKRVLTLVKNIRVGGI